MEEQKLMARECIILSGGLGTRLKSVVPDLPKSMAYIDGQPFMSYLVRYFLQQGVRNFIFALGYKHDVIETYLASKDFPFHNTDAQYKISVEKEPLGTGGAILKAASLCTLENVIVANGDTLFDVDIASFEQFHIGKNALCSLALKPMEKFERYGAVELGENETVASFQEKRFYEKGNINGGVYFLNVQRFLAMNFSEKFSFEKDFLERQTDQKALFGLIQNGYFIDIGIPEDYERAQIELPALFSK